MKSSIKNNIPNTITILNIISGFIGIIMILRFQNPMAGVLCMMIAGFFDLSDGLAARLLHAKSNIGKELDSLCDVVSFGILPGTLMFDMLTKLLVNQPQLSWLPFIAFLIPAFAAVRLAIFNTNEQTLSTFFGLSSPGAAFFFASLVLNSKTLPLLQQLNPITASVILIAVILFFCIMMASKVKFLTLKFQSFAFKTNYLTYIFMAIGITLLILFGLDAPLYIFILYVILSMVFAK